jgi:hypothetical protein
LEPSGFATLQLAAKSNFPSSLYRSWTMATKSDFTSEEWGKLLASPMVAGMAITAADPSGVWGLIKEGMAGGWALVEARQNAQANPLVKAVAEDFATSGGRAAARTELQARFGGGANAAALKNVALSELRSVAKILGTKAPADAASFRLWLQGVAQKAAEAGTEGGFLGFGGVAVSDAEKATLAEISTALTSDQST